jgi:ABC-type sugar transport system ATPase subunit
MSDILLESVSKRFGSILAVDRVSLRVEAGELLVICGPSGSGKTTLLRLIAGLEEPSSGIIRIAGRDVARCPPRERNLAMVFQQPALVPNKTVRWNWAFALRAQRLSRRDQQERIDATADALEATALLDRRADELSGGETQRAALGRALVRQPAICLLDEPFSQVDAPSRATLRRKLLELQRQWNMTTLYVTHDQWEAMAMADRLLLMTAGRTMQLGTPEQLYHWPASRAVAEFLGIPPMNFFRATLHRTDNTWRLETAGVSWCWHADQYPQVGQNGGIGQVRSELVDVGIRAEDCLRYIAHTEALDGNHWREVPVQIVRRWMHGPWCFADLRCDALDCNLTILDESLNSPGATNARREHSVQNKNANGTSIDKIYMDLRRLHIFSRADGRRIYCTP